MSDWRSRGIRLRAGPASAATCAVAFAVASAVASLTASSSSACVKIAPGLAGAESWASVRSACAVLDPSR